MADITNLTQFLTDVADAIRNKTGSINKIPAEEFDQLINTISTEASVSSIDFSIDINEEDAHIGTIIYGTFGSSSSVTLATYDYILPQGLSDIKGVLALQGIGNGTSGTAEIVWIYPIESGSLINNQDKEITKNGKYTADEGYTGLGTVNVEVPQENELTPADYEAALQLCNDIKGNPAPKEGHIYGVRKPLDGITLERTDDARGLIAEATHNGHPEEVTNNFDELEPWASIKSFMYDSQKEEVIHWFGDNDFTFKPTESYINIFTRIPRFWYRHYKDEQYEYWKVADYAAEDFNEFIGASPARYSVSGSSSVPRSVSGGALLTSTAGNTYRNASKILGNYNGLFDIWSVGAIQTLYLVEYANADSQLMLGNGVSSGSKTVTGGCDSLGMKSGCMSNSGASSVIYRGFEDIFGNVYDLIDGINIVNRQSWVCEDWTKYNFTNTSDYKQLNYVNVSSNNYGKKLGLDENYPLVMLPTVVSSSAESFTKDYYYQDSGNMAMRLGGDYGLGDACGLFFASCYSAASYSDTYSGARFLLHKIS